MTDHSTMQLLAEKCASSLYERDPCSQHLGIEVVRIAPGEATLSMQVKPFMENGHRLCHGGIIFTLADSAFAFACNSYDQLTVAAGADTNFIAPAYCGDVLTAVCTERVRSGRTGVYDVEVFNQKEKLIAQFRGRSYCLNKPLLDPPTNENSNNQ